MEFEQIKELINLVSQSKISAFELKTDEVELSMGKNTVMGSHENGKEVLAGNMIINENITEPFTVIPEPPAVIEEGFLVKSPIVGTFYDRAQPDRPPFVKLGDKVNVGDCLCIVEAMKVMNEVASEYAGTIAEIYVKNENMLEYNQNLFRIV